MKKALLPGVFILSSLGIFFLVFYLQQHACDDATCLTKVGNETIKKGDVAQETSRMKQLYQAAKQDLGNYPALEKDAAQRLTEHAIITTYARKNNIKVSQQELENRYKAVAVKQIKNSADVSQFSPAVDKQFLEKLNGLSYNKESYLERLTIDLLQFKIQEHTKIPFAEWLAKEKQKYAPV